MWRSIRICGLLWADIISYALFEMQTYLTDVLGVSMSRAAATVNIWIGISLILQPLFLFLVDSLLGNFGMLVISSSAHTVGIFFVYLSAPPVLANLTGTCRNYEPECIGETQKVLLYTGMVLVAVGAAGNNVSLKSFLQEQPKKPSYDPEVHGVLKVDVVITFILTCVAIGGSLLLPYLKRFTILVGIPAICTFIVTISFLTGLCWKKYKISGPREIHDDNFQKMFDLSMSPMWLVFIVGGIVSSIGKTYFVEQARHLDRHLGKWEVPTQMLLLVRNLLIKIVAYVPREIFKMMGAAVVMGEIFGVLCCIVAAIMEIKRLGIVRSHGLLDKPDEDIPMSMYWLLIQFILLGCMESSLEKSTVEFDTKTQLPNETEIQCLEIFSKGISGVGFMLNVPLVYVIGKLSAVGDRPSWFQSTSNKSRLDHYYWVLVAFSGASLVLFVWGRLCCWNRCLRRE